MMTSILHLHRFRTASACNLLRCARPTGLSPIGNPSSLHSSFLVRGAYGSLGNPSPLYLSQRAIWVKSSGHESGETTFKTSGSSAARGTQFRERAFYAVYGVILTLITVPGGLFLYYASHFERVPITNRKRMLWYNRDYDEEIGHGFESWILTQKDKPRLDNNDPVTKMVQGVLNQLCRAEVAKGLEFKLNVYDEWEHPNAYATSGKRGGRIIINTGCLYGCNTPGQVASVLSHEMGHVIARHVIELHTANAFAVNISRWFGYRGPLGSDLPTSRLQEVEADHIGLVIMAEAGFDPHERVDYVSSLLTQELEHLKGREPTPEFLCTHPSLENRLKFAKALMPEVQKRYTGKGKPKSVTAESDEWKNSRSGLIKSLEDYWEKRNKREEMQPEKILEKVEQRLQKIEGIFIQMEERLLKDGQKTTEQKLLDNDARKSEVLGTPNNVAEESVVTVQQTAAETSALQTTQPGNPTKESKRRRRRREKISKD